MVGSALLWGTIIGFERPLRGKPAGIRTGCLVTGVGFPGAGGMIAQEGVVQGVTTGAVIWVLAAIGSAIGLGFVQGGVALSIVTVAIFVGIEKLETSVLWLARGVHDRGDAIRESPDGEANSDRSGARERGLHPGR